MRRIVFLYYTLFSLITISCFAALNKLQEGYYGIAGGCLLFALIFIVIGGKGIPAAKNNREARVDLLELVGLIIIAVIFFLKTYQYLFLGITWIHIIGIAVLLIATLLKLFHWIKIKDKVRANVYTANLVLTISYLLLLIADLLQTINLDFVVVLVFTGLILGTVAVIYIVYVRVSHFLLTGNKVEFFDVEKFRGYWLFLAYILIFTYQLAVEFNITDKVYFKRMPQKYVELFYQAEHGQEEPIDGKYQFQIYKEEYQKLINKGL